MGQHQDGDLQPGFEGLQFFHDSKRVGRVLGAAAQAGNIIDDEHIGIKIFYLELNSGVNKIVE